MLVKKEDVDPSAGYYYAGIPMEPHAHSVLFADDDADTREVLALALEAAGMHVQAVPDGGDALRLLRTGLRPCALLLDLMMPEVDGLDVLDDIYAHPDLIAIPVIMVSGHPELAERAVRLGVRAYLAKPVETDVLVRTVTEHCPQRRT